jgi:DNA-binding NtrC family response regulator
MGASQNSRTVWIVDDEEVIVRTLATILEFHGFRTEVFLNPLDALERAKYVAPDLLITDVAMPQMSGVDLAVAITESQPLCKVLLFSGQASTVDLFSNARRRNRNFTLLAKPVHPTDLLAAVATEFRQEP